LHITSLIAPNLKVDVGHEKRPMHIVTLSFDDGFGNSNRKIAEIYEKHGLSACFNVIAAGHLDAEVGKLLSLPSGWLIYTTHGLDDEGWGPIGAGYLDRLLGRLSSISTVRILPTGAALKGLLPK